MPRGKKTQTVVTVQQNPQQSNNQKKRRNRKKNNGKPAGTNRTQVATIPVARTTVVHTRGARYSSSKNGSMCVSHEELFGTLTGSNDFACGTVNINPGLSGLFPWLCQIARNYESYKFRKLRFKYVAASGSGQAGTVYLGAEFDPADPAPTDENQLASYQGTASCSPWKDLSYTCTVKNLSKRQSYFVRNGDLPANADAALYDVGYFIFGAADNVTDGVKLGKLWVEYEVELSTPQISNPGIGSALSAYFTGANKATTVPTKVGNAPLTATVAANVLTITATAPYQGLVALNVSGTGVGGAPLNPLGGTATSAPKALLADAGATIAVGQYTANFKRGQTLIFNMSSWTTVSGYFLRFGQYDYSNG